jgi:GNAT superfamily N-acetyltransferase
MLKSLFIDMQQFIEGLAHTGLKRALRKALFINQLVIPVVKNLEKIAPSISVSANLDVSFISISHKMLPQLEYAYRVKSRRLKAKRNANYGLSGFAVVSRKTIIGDIWYTTWKTSRHPHLHEDIDLLFLDPGPKDVYMFDLFVEPGERGKNIALPLMRHALFQLSELGYKNVFGYFNAQYVPALWVHRILKFKELDGVLLSRFFFKRFSRKQFNK